MKMKALRRRHVWGPTWDQLLSAQSMTLLTLKKVQTLIPSPYLPTLHTRLTKSQTRLLSAHPISFLTRLT